jgi:hypothetical protein
MKEWIDWKIFEKEERNRHSLLNGSKEPDDPVFILTIKTSGSEDGCAT